MAKKKNLDKEKQKALLRKTGELQREIDEEFEILKSKISQNFTAFGLKIKAESEQI